MASLSRGFFPCIPLRVFSITFFLCSITLFLEGFLNLPAVFTWPCWWKGKLRSPFSKPTGKIILYAGLTIVVVSVTLLFLVARHYNIMHATDAIPGILINNLLMPAGIVLIFYSLIYQKSLLQKFLSGKLMVALGNSTYSFYLLHTTFVLSYIYKFIGSNVFVTFILMIVIAYIFYKLVEQPLANLIKRKFIRKVP